jgi:probable phosphoglycerate mutase
MTLVLHLVRHGQSTWNAAGRVQGSTAHPPLTAAGRRQAGDAAAALRALGADALLTSDLRRAAQTAEVIGRELGLEPVAEPALREQALGTLEGRLASTLTEQPMPPGRHVSEVRWGGPCSETLVELHARVGALLTSLLAHPPGSRLVLVSHADAIRAMLAWLAGRGPDRIDWHDVPFGSVWTRGPITAGVTPSTT